MPPSKREFLLRLLSTGQLKPGPIAEMMTTATANIAQLPKEERPAKPITRSDVNQTLCTYRGGVKATNGQAPLPRTAPAPEQFSAEELTACKRLLQACGGSSFRAAAVLKIVSYLTSVVKE